MFFYDIKCQKYFLFMKYMYNSFMKIYLYLDESGLIHKNSNINYFVVGGYYTNDLYKNKILSKYRKLNYEIKLRKRSKLDKELKSHKISVLDKIKIFNTMNSFKYFNICTKVYDKTAMSKKISEGALFYNYAVKLLLIDELLPYIKHKDVIFYLNIDNRNLSKTDEKNLEFYLNRELKEFRFIVKYFDSRKNYGIQLADIIVNTYYHYFENYKYVKKIIKNVDVSNVKISLFPYKKVNLSKLNKDLLTEKNK